jgi:alpha-1,6-mannosyltransferase
VRPVPRIVDVAMFYGERSGGIRTYLQEKSAYARATGTFEHHAVVPGRVERHADGWHELRALRVAASNGYRIPLGVGALKSTLRDIRPDFVLLHDAFWGPHGVCELAHQIGARTIAVHHASTDLNAAGLPGPYRLYVPAFRAWIRRAYRNADAVMSAVDPRPDSGRDVDLPLRFGLDPAFVPHPGLARRDHVLYAGRFGREKGVFELIDAAAHSTSGWRVHLVGTGPAQGLLAARARRAGISERVLFLPYVSDRERLARLYGEASCVVMPGPFETFGLVALEAAASGARVVACETAPSAAVIGGLAHTFRVGDPEDMLRAIEEARATDPDPVAARELSERLTWPRAFAAELADLEALAA